MRNLLALVGLAVVGFFGLGWYLGWYTFAVAPAPDGKKRISFDVDTTKIAADAKQAREKVGTLLQSDGAPSTARKPEPAPTTPPADDNTPGVRLTPEGRIDVKVPQEVEVGGVRLTFPKER